jgi:hypothetical protein
MCIPNISNIPNMCILMYGDLTGLIYMDPCSVARDKNSARPFQRRCYVMFCDINRSEVESRVSTLSTFFKKRKIYFQASGNFYLQ